MRIALPLEGYRSSNWSGTLRENELTSAFELERLLTVVGEVLHAPARLR
jgi:hypothetical protein